VVISVAVFLRAIGQEYRRFEYDDEVVKAVAARVRAAEERFREYGIQITCDR
jgi:hypothetical protein